MWKRTEPLPVSDADLDPINHPWMVALRQQMLRNEPQAGCIKCYQNEASKGSSMRTDFNRQHGRLTEPRLTYLEMNFGNLCNLKCRMCNSASSSRWIADEIKLGKIPLQLVRRTIDDIKVDFSSLERIKLIGGEVSLEQDHVQETLRRIAKSRGDLRHLEIEIITNGMVQFESDIMDQLRACKQVMMQVSMDGLGSVNDYQRTGAEWRVIADTARYYHSFTAPNWQLIITSCVTIYNIHGVTALCDWVATELPLAKHICQPAVDPAVLTLRNLPDTYKSKLTVMLQHWKPVTEPGQPDWLPYGRTAHREIRRNLLWNLSQTPNRTPAEVQSHHQQLDQLRGEDLATLDPRLQSDLFG